MEQDVPHSCFDFLLSSLRPVLELLKAKLGQLYATPWCLRYKYILSCFRAWRIPLRRRGVQAGALLARGLPHERPQSQVHHQDLPPEHRQAWTDLSRHSKGWETKNSQLSRKLYHHRDFELVEPSNIIRLNAKEGRRCESITCLTSLRLCLRSNYKLAFVSLKWPTNH